MSVFVCIQLIESTLLLHLLYDYLLLLLNKSWSSLSSNILLSDDTATPAEGQVAVMVVTT